MKVLQRSANISVALALGILSAPAALFAQTRSNVPNPDTPRLLVAVFASADRAAGVQTADAIRTRVQAVSNIKQLYVISKTDITNYLESSGYKADSSLGPTDLKELAKLLRADEVLSGSVTKTATGVRIEPRLMLARDVALAQPLPAVEAGSPTDAARQIERTLADARRQLPDNKACENGIRDRLWAKAIASANAGIAKYPNATIARLCLANVYLAMATTADSVNAPPDSVLRITDAIRKLDPKNSQALRFAYAAYDRKGDQKNAVGSLVTLLALEPGNPTLQGQVISALAKLGQPKVAGDIIDQLLIQSPGDPVLLRQKWLLSLAAAAGDTGSVRASFFGRAVSAGEEMVKIDTTLADSVYFSRQIIAANAMTPPRGLEFASRAVQKYPNSPEFWALKANAERKLGQNQMALESLKHALSINPKYPNGNLLMAQIYLEMNQPDSAVAVARRAIAGGEDPKTWGAFLLGPSQSALKLAQSTDSVAYYRRALALAQESDRLSPSQFSKFLIGVTSFQVGVDALRQADPLQRVKKPDKPKICALARTTQDMFVLTQTTMPQGGSVDPKVASQVLGVVQQYGPAADQMAKKNCK